MNAEKILTTWWAAQLALIERIREIEKERTSSLASATLKHLADKLEKEVRAEMADE